jgi:hypothetical protein
LGLMMRSFAALRMTGLLGGRDRKSHCALGKNDVG